MKLIISFFLMLSSAAFANTDSRIYHNYGRLLVGQDNFSCEIQNNTSMIGVIHKVRYEFECVDRFNRLYQEVSYFRCGEDYENCEIAAHDFDAIPGPSRNVCHYVRRANCYFSYSFLDDSN